MDSKTDGGRGKKKEKMVVWWVYNLNDSKLRRWKRLAGSAFEFHATVMDREARPVTCLLRFLKVNFLGSMGTLLLLNF